MENVENVEKVGGYQNRNTSRIAPSIVPGNFIALHRFARVALRYREGDGFSGNSPDEGLSWFF